MNYQILVNKENPLSKEFVPKNLIAINEEASETLDKNHIISLEKETYNAFKQMQNEALKNNVYIYVDSGYRSYEYQQKIYNNIKETQGEINAINKAAIPGTSEHQTGLAFDVIYKENELIIIKTNPKSITMQWMYKNAHKFGFILRYPKGKEHITKYNYEPWHFRYVGKELAKYLYLNKLTLEEYYNQKR